MSAGLSAPVTIAKQMGITHAEFMRLLPRALGSQSFQFNGSVITFAGDDGQSLKIELGPEDVRQIALMRIATTPVTLTFSGYADADRQAFLTRFDRTYQRGGG